VRLTSTFPEFRERESEPNSDFSWNDKHQTFELPSGIEPNACPERGRQSRRKAAERLQ
jgi:hypothetical protein